MTDCETLTERLAPLVPHAWTLPNAAPEDSQRFEDLIDAVADEVKKAEHAGFTDGYYYAGYGDCVADTEQLERE